MKLLALSEVPGLIPVTVTFRSAYVCDSTAMAETSCRPCI